MGCGSSRENVKSGNLSKKILVAPELLHENYLTSSFIHTHEEYNRKSHRRLSIVGSEVRRNFTALPKLEFPETNHNHDRTPSTKCSDETVATQNREKNTTLPKSGTLSDPEKLFNEPEVIDVCELMEGLEDAEDLRYSAFRITQTNKDQSHNRSSSLSVMPSLHNSELPVDPESRLLRHSLSQSYHQRVESYSPVRDYEEKVFTSGKDSSRETVCKDVVTVIKEVIERPAHIKPTSAGTIRKKLFNSSTVARLDSSRHPSQVSDKVSTSEILSDQIDSPVRAGIREKCKDHQLSNKNHTSQISKTLSSIISFDFNFSAENFSTDDEILSADATDEFSFNTQIPQKEVTQKVEHNDLEDDMALEETILEELFKNTSSVGNSTLFPSIPLQSMNSVNLNDFERLTPPGGENRVVLYATSSCDKRRTYEDCNLVRQILHSYKIDLDERDILLHPELNHELQQIMQSASLVSVPRLFIKERHIGGVEEVCILHKTKALERLLQAFSSEYMKALCVCCGGTRTLQCLGCNGMRWIRTEEGNVISCNECEKKGWIMCPICS